MMHYTFTYQDDVFAGIPASKAVLALG